MYGVLVVAVEQTMRAAALTPVFIYGAASVMGNWRLVFPIYGVLATAAGAALFVRFSPAKCFPWCIGLCVLAVAAFFVCSGPVAFLSCVFVASVASANTFVMCMGIALDKLPEKANEITALMVMAIAGGAVVPPILGFAQKCAGSTGLVWVLLACLAYQTVLSVCMYKNANEREVE